MISRLKSWERSSPGVHAAPYHFPLTSPIYWLYSDTTVRRIRGHLRSFSLASCTTLQSRNAMYGFDRNSYRIWDCNPIPSACADCQVFRRTIRHQRRSSSYRTSCPASSQHLNRCTTSVASSASVGPWEPGRWGDSPHNLLWMDAAETVIWNLSGGGSGGSRFPSYEVRTVAILTQFLHFGHSNTRDMRPSKPAGRDTRLRASGLEFARSSMGVLLIGVAMAVVCSS